MIAKKSFQIYSFMCLLFLAGCMSEYNLATKQEETYLYSTEREVNIGYSVSRQIEDHYKFINDVDANERAQKILDKIVSVCDRQDIVYFIRIIDDDPVNAVSLPGGYIYLFKGLMDKVENDDQLAGVIAHEVGHITARHGVKRLQAAYGAMLLQIAAAATAPQISGGVGLALDSLFMQYSLEDELKADSLSIKYMKKAGYDPEQMVAFLEILKKEQERAPLRKFSYWRTHPFISQRIASANTEIKGKMEFRDYLNLIGEE